MRKTWLIQCVPLFFFFQSNCQVFGDQYEAKVIGGKEQLEQVIETQLYLPKLLLNSGNTSQIKVFFDLDSAGNAIHTTFNEEYNNVLRNEVTRLLKFLHFTHTQDPAFEPYPYWLSFQFSSDKYKKFIKQKYKLNSKSTYGVDSSFTVYARADRSPEYYKNGEEGMAEFVLSEIEYPKLAIEKSVEGTVVVEFIVETNGYVTGLTVKRAVGAGCSEEALRILKLSRWKPAIYKDKLVRYKKTYPITFSLKNSSRENSASSRTMGQ